MAANSTTKTGVNLALGLTQVEPALAAWRQRRRHREAIPEDLWRLIVPLARAHGVSPVAQALGLNYTTLKAHTRLGQSAATATKRPEDFLEVPVVGWPAAAVGSLELADGQGTKLTVRLTGTAPGAVLALAQGLWQQRA